MYIAYYFFWYSWGGNICQKDKRYFLDEKKQLVEIYFNNNCSYLYVLLGYLLCLKRKIVVYRQTDI